MRPNMSWSEPEDRKALYDSCLGLHRHVASATLTSVIPAKAGTHDKPLFDRDILHRRSSSLAVAKRSASGLTRFATGYRQTVRGAQLPDLFILR
jgi:hypothetical protein